MTLAHPPLIETPADFPVTWDDPADQALFWTWDQMHHPHPVSPLGRDLFAIAFGSGMTKGLRGIGVPMRERRVRSINTFYYAATIPDPERLPTAQQTIEAAVRERGPSMYQRWLDEYLPEVEAANDRLLGFDYRGASDAELMACIDWTFTALERMWEIHFSLMPGFMISASFKSFCVQHLGLSPIGAFELMQGGHNLSVESGSKLWQLAHSAPDPVKDLLRSASAADAYARLQETEEGRAFLARLHEYLDVYGWRKGNFDILDPAWTEEPWRALEHVRMMLRVATDPAEDQRRGAERAEERAAACRAMLADQPQVLAQFEHLYTVVKCYPQLQENHNFYIDQKFMALTRLPFVEAGRRMAEAGLIKQAGDFAYLTLAEITGFLGGDRTALQQWVAERRAEMALWRDYLPPQAIGTRPAVDQTTEWGTDFFGAAVEPSTDPTIVKGLPASRGTATGTARVVRTLAEAHRIEDGDILVCDMTTPAWTPLFASLGGIVADSGGPLSHCAVVAREYGVPCVVGTRIGSRVIRDGARITVDGGQGIVRIEG